MLNSVEKRLGIVIQTCDHGGDLVFLINVEFVTKEVAHNTLALIDEFLLQCLPGNISHFTLLLVRNLLKLVDNGFLINLHSVSLILNLVMNLVLNSFCRSGFKNRCEIYDRKLSLFV